MENLLCGKSVFIPPVCFPLLTAIQQGSLCICFKSPGGKKKNLKTNLLAIIKYLESIFKPVINSEVAQIECKNYCLKYHMYTDHFEDHTSIIPYISIGLSSLPSMFP